RFSVYGDMMLTAWGNVSAEAYTVRLYEIGSTGLTLTGTVQKPININNNNVDMAAPGIAFNGPDLYQMTPSIDSLSVSLSDLVSNECEKSNLIQSSDINVT